MDTPALSRQGGRQGGGGREGGREGGGMEGGRRGEGRGREGGRREGGRRKGGREDGGGREGLRGREEECMGFFNWLNLVAGVSTAQTYMDQCNPHSKAILMLCRAALSPGINTPKQSTVGWESVIFSISIITSMKSITGSN